MSIICTLPDATPTAVRPACRAMFAGGNRVGAAVTFHADEYMRKWRCPPA